MWLSRLKQTQPDVKHAKQDNIEEVVLRLQGRVKFVNDLTLMLEG